MLDGDYEYGESYQESFPKDLLRKCLHVDGGTHTGVPCSSTSGATVTATLYDIATLFTAAAALAAATENSPAPPNNVGPTNDPQDQPVDPPTTTLDGDDVSDDNGIVNYVTVSIKVSGYAPSEFNVANRKAFALGLALYLNVSSGADGVSLLGVDASQRRRLLSSSSLVHVKVLLTTQDSPVAVLAAMDNNDASKIAALQTVMKTVLPKVEQMEVTTATISTNSDVGVYVPPNNEVQDVKEFGGGLIATAIFVVFFTPLIVLIVGVVAGPDSRIGRIVMVFIGEEKYAKLNSACCGARAAEPTAPQKHARKRLFFV